MYIYRERELKKERKRGPEQCRKLGRGQSRECSRRPHLSTQSTLSSSCPKNSPPNLPCSPWAQTLVPFSLFLLALASYLYSSSKKSRTSLALTKLKEHTMCKTKKHPISVCVREREREREREGGGGSTRSSKIERETLTIM